MAGDHSVGMVVLKLLVLLLLVLANGFFVSSEFALVRVRRSRLIALAEQGKGGAKAALRLLENPKIFISVTQLGVTLASLGLGWMGESTLAKDVFVPVFVRLIPGNFAPYVSAHAVSIIIAFAVVTFLTIVLGEITPKTLALDRAQTIALLVARPLELFYKSFRPFIHVLNASSAFLLARLGLERNLTSTMAYSEEELRQIVSMSFQSGVLNEEERRVIHNIFDFTDKTVGEVMVPRLQVSALSSSLTQKEAVAEFVKTGYSRMPVYTGPLDNFIGVVHGKDLMAYIAKSPRGFNLAAIARKPLFVPDTATLDEALKQMQSRKAHLALVVDEHGDFEGIVTLEDLLEEIVGEIQDEHDEASDQELFSREPDGAIIAAGWTPVREANKLLGLDVPESDDYNTLAGFLLSRSGKVLSAGDKVQYGPFVFSVEEVDRHRVVKVKITKTEPAPQATGVASTE
jgi:CBS domain containing-hemolysin-like protein